MTTETDHGRLWRLAHLLGLVRDPAEQPPVGSRRWWIDMAVIFVIVVVVVVVGAHFWR